MEWNDKQTFGISLIKMYSCSRVSSSSSILIVLLFLGINSTLDDVPEVEVGVRTPVVAPYGD